MNKEGFIFEQHKRGVNLSYANRGANLHYHGSASNIIPNFIFKKLGDNNEN